MTVTCDSTLVLFRDKQLTRGSTPFDLTTVCFYADNINFAYVFRLKPTFHRLLDSPLVCCALSPIHSLKQTKQARQQAVVCIEKSSMCDAGWSSHYVPELGERASNAQCQSQHAVYSASPCVVFTLLACKLDNRLWFLSTIWLYINALAPLQEVKANWQRVRLRQRRMWQDQRRLFGTWWTS